MRQQGNARLRTLTFTPSGPGTRTASLTITDNVAGSPQVVTLSGTGNNPAPALASLSPVSAIAGSTSQILTLNGTNFLSTSTVTYNGVAHAPTPVSGTQMTIALTTADLATAGSYPVVVTNPGPGGGTSSAVNFTVTINNPAPTHPACRRFRL